MIVPGRIFVPDCPKEPTGDRKILLIGEAPGFYEEQRGEPFVGPSGKLLEEWWKDVGLKREYFHITNVYPFRPPSNKIDKIPADEIRTWTYYLHQKIANMQGLNLIVPTGGFALKALLDTKNSITQLRGSILEYTDANGRKIKVIPTLHPAAVLRTRGWERRCRMDWDRIVGEMDFPERPHLLRAVKISPLIQEIRDWVSYALGEEFGGVVRDPASYLSIDIETNYKEITCVGFAANGVSAICIPVGIKRTEVVEKKKARKTKEDKEFEAKFWKERVQFTFDCELGEMVDIEAKSEYANVPKKLQKAVHKLVTEGKVTPALKKNVEYWEEQQTKYVTEANLYIMWPHLKKVHALDSTKSYRTVGYWKTEEENSRAWIAIRKLCSSDIPKIGQKFQFDMYWLKKEQDIEVNGEIWDTLSMHHCLYPTEDRHSLAYMASIYTDQPYWKDDTKDADKKAFFSTSAEALWNYNCIDTTVTYQVFETLQQELLSQDKMEFFKVHYQEMMRPLLDVMLNGIRVNKEELKLKAEIVEQNIKVLKDEITKIAGKDLYGKVKLSPQKLSSYLYDDLHLPRQMRKRQGKEEKTVSSDELAVRTLMLRFPNKLQKIGQLILDCQKYTKQMEFLGSDLLLDVDDKMRSEYKFTTESGRLASSSNPMSTGRNAQNIDRTMRDIFVPDKVDWPMIKGFKMVLEKEIPFFLKCDLSQAESRVVYMLTRNPHLVEEARTLPHEYNMHEQNAKDIFKISEVTEDQYYLGKKAVHASQRGMKGKKLSEELLKDGYVRTVEECDVLINNYLSMKPDIVDVYFKETREKLWKDRKLVNSWGREIHWAYERFDDDLYRKAYSFLPQSEVADLLNQWGLKQIYNAIQKNKYKTTINAQVHDEVLLSTNLKEGFWIAMLLKSFLEVPRSYAGELMTIPVEISIGSTWDCEVKWKKFPSQEEFNEEAKGIVNTIKGE